MEKELTELFESVKKSADLAENSPGEEEKCLDALKQLKEFPVNYQILVSTQVGKRLRQLTKHPRDKIKSLASEVVNIWKNIIVNQTAKSKKNGTTENTDSAKSESTGTESSDIKKYQRTNSVNSEHKPAPKKVKLDQPSGKLTKSDTSPSVKIEKKSSEIQKSAPKKVKLDQPSNPNTPNSSTNSPIVKIENKSSEIEKPNLTSLAYTKDPIRDKIRELIAESLSKVPNEIDGQDQTLEQKVSQSDACRVAVSLESAMYEKWGKSNGPHKFKYRSVMFNIKDPNNPDFRRKVLVGAFAPPEILELTPDDMASDQRQEQNEKIKEKALFNSELGGPPKASTDEFTCSRCKKKETTYYQLQTRSADEPMTTFVTCVNCNKRWKF